MNFPPCSAFTPNTSGSDLLTDLRRSRLSPFIQQGLQMCDARARECVLCATCELDIQASSNVEALTGGV